MNQLLELNAGDTLVFDMSRAAWFADDGEPLTKIRTARAKLKKPVNFYAEEGVRSHNMHFEIVESFKPDA